MLGAIAGDVIGSVYEFMRDKPNFDFPLFSGKCIFTDDTVLTCAVADAITNNHDYGVNIRNFAIKYPNRGYGGMFGKWIKSEKSTPYNSYGNGSAMRVSPVGFAFKTLRETLLEAEKSAVCTHNHPEGIKGAKATAAAVFLARTEENKSEIKKYIEREFEYDLSDTVENLRINYGFDPSCQGTVPQAIIAFLESNDFEDAIRKAVYIGGDSDTIAAITGGIAQAFYKKIPKNIVENTFNKLDKTLKTITTKFSSKFKVKY